MDEWDLARLRTRRGPWSQGDTNFAGSIDPGTPIGQQAAAAATMATESVDELPLLPDDDYDAGKLIVLTTDNQTYRSTGTAWTLTVEGDSASSISDLIQYGVNNGSFSLPPLDTTLPIDTGNEVPYWGVPTSVSGSSIEWTYVDSSASPSGHILRATMSSGSAGDESYMEQIVPVGGSGNNFLGHAVMVSFAASADATARSLSIKSTYLDETGAAVGSTVTTNSGSLSGGVILTGLRSLIGGQGATARSLRIRVHYLRDAAAPTDIGTVSIYDVRLATVPHWFMLKEYGALETPATPPTPPSGFHAIYPKSADSKLYSKDDSGTEYLLSTGISGFAAPNLTLGTANAAGAATTVIRSDATILAFDATTPAAISTSGAVGVATVAARRDHGHAHEAAHIQHDTTWAAKGDIIAATGNDAAAVVTVGADDTILMADAAAASGVKWVASGTPSTQAFGDAATVGTADTFTRGDHKHAMPTARITTSGITIATATVAGRATAGTGAVEELATTGTGSVVLATSPTLVTPLLGTPTSGVATNITGLPPAGVTFAATSRVLGRISASGGVGEELTAANLKTIAGYYTSGDSPTFTGTNFTGIPESGVTNLTTDLAGKSANPHSIADHTDRTTRWWCYAKDATLDSGTLTTLGTLPNQIQVVALADAATQGCYWTWGVPTEWDQSSSFSIKPVWVPGSTDATPHTVRWSIDVKAIAAGTDVTAAGTTTTWTGASAARTVNLAVTTDTVTDSTVTATGVAAGQHVMINLRRIGADGADTYVGTVNVIGIVISYTVVQ